MWGSRDTLHLNAGLWVDNPGLDPVDHRLWVPWVDVGGMAEDEGRIEAGRRVASEKHGYSLPR